MELPDNHGDLEQAKLAVASRFRNYESSLMKAIEELANSGFADKRLCAVARTDFERAFLILEKAIRIGAPDEYAKQPGPPGGYGFTQRVDPAGDRNVAPHKHIEWRDLPGFGGPDDGTT